MKLRSILVCLALVLVSADPARDQAALAGIWEISAMIDNGEVVAPATLKAYLVKDAQLSIQGQVLTLTIPTSQQKREVLFVLDSSTSPKTIDLAGATRTGSRGIYLLSGDTLLLCLGGLEAQNRPLDFSSLPGSHNILMTLKRVIPPPVVAKPVAVPVVPVATNPPVSRDEEYRRTLVGTWGHQDEEKVVMTTFNPDGSFSRTVSWKKGFKRVFHEDVRTSGAWRVENGSVILRVTASTESQGINQVYSMRINTLYTTEVIYTDQEGKIRAEWKTR